MSTYRMKLFAGALLILQLFAPPLFAQPQRRLDEPSTTRWVDRPVGSRRQPRERIEVYKKMKLLEVLDLEEENAVRFFSKYNKHESELQAVHREMKETINQIERMVRENAPEPEFEEGFNRLQELETKLDGERRRFLKDLREILTVQQIGKFIVFERNFGERVQEIMREMRRERRRDRHWD